MASHHSSPGAPNWLIQLFTYGIGFALAGSVLFWAVVFLAGIFQSSRPKVAEKVKESERAAVADVAAAAPANSVPPLFEEGKVIYTTICGVCHQPTGIGLPNMFPPLAGSDWVKAAAPDRLIRIVLHGFQGPIHVNGQAFSTPAPLMPPQGALPDEKIAAVLTYIRHSWDNAASAVTPDQVKAVREADKGRVAMWTEEELLKIPLAAGTP